MLIEPFADTDIPVVKELEQKVFGEQQVPWDLVLTPDGQKRFDVCVIRDPDRDNQLIAVAALDNRRGIDRYKKGWAALHTVRDLDPKYAGLGSRLLEGVKWRLERKRKVGDEPVKAIYCRVHQGQEKLVDYFKREGFVHPSDDDQEEGAVVMHWHIPPKAGCRLM